MNKSLLISLKKPRVIMTSLAFVGLLYGAVHFLGYFWDQRVEVGKNNVELDIKKSLNAELFKTQNWPDEVRVSGDDFEIRYTFNDKLSEFVEKLLKKHRSDYSAIVVIDNNSGDILSATGFERKTGSFQKNLAFSSTHPAASLFKIVTSAELFENDKVTPKTKFTYNGKGTTLYRNQLKKRVNKWSRSQIFERAFAVSNNVIFGKAAIYRSDPESLFNMASNFGFNKDLMPVVSSVRSEVKLPENDYALAELATGFNKKTLISPIHGAFISSIIANGGFYRQPSIIKEVIRKSDGKKFLKRDLNSQDETILNYKTTHFMQEVMEETVSSGTARKYFRRLKKKLKSKLAIGGKTGSITGGLPHGKRDWFSVYAKPKDGEDLGISICVMNVNLEKWYVKSTFLAKEIIQYYYNNVSPLEKDKTVLANHVRR